MKNRLLFVDTETGGLEPENSSLLSIGYGVWDNKKIIDKGQFLIQSEYYSVTAAALKINNIAINEIYSNGISACEVIERFKVLKEKYFYNNLITLAGHNIQFDIAFIKKLFRDNNVSYDSIFSHRAIDTSSILRFLYYSNRLKEDISSSNNAFNYFKIYITNRHTALDDCIATAELFNELILLNEK